MMTDDVLQITDIMMTAPDETKGVDVTHGDCSAERISQQNILRKTSRSTSVQEKICLLLALHKHGVFLVITLFSNTYQNANLQKLIANYNIRRLLLPLLSWKLSLLSCTREELHDNEIYICMGCAIVQKME